MSGQSKKHWISVLGALVFVCGATAHVQAQPVGDAQKGASLFATHCAECHSMKEGKHKKGPALFSILGTKAGQQAGYAYSEAMKSSNVTWTAEALGRYVTSPKGFIPGGKMKYDGMENPGERADLLAYLSSQGK